MVTLDQLRVCMAVVDAGSFSGAARRLHRAQSAVSHAIDTLEHRLGVALFDRTGYRPVLTEAGQALLPEIKAVSLRVDALMERARGVSDSEASLSVAVDSVFPMTRLLKHLGSLRTRFPHVVVDVQTFALGGVLEPISTGKCDLAIGHLFEDAPEHVVAHPIAGVLSAFYVSEHHPLAEKTVVQLDELATQVQIALSGPTEQPSGSERGVFSTRVWRTADLHAKRLLIQGGFGFGWLPVHLAQAVQTGSALVQLHIARYPKTVELELATLVHRQRPLGPAGRWLLEQSVELGPTVPG